VAFGLNSEFTDLLSRSTTELPRSSRGKRRQTATVAKESGVAREALYRTLSESGNPTFGNLSAILKSVGLRIEVTPIRGNTGSGSSTPKGLPNFTKSITDFI
jgi:hypothetical protein